MNDKVREGRLRRERKNSPKTSFFIQIEQAKCSDHVHALQVSVDHSHQSHEQRTDTTYVPDNS